jgi:hypothetical protein
MKTPKLSVHKSNLEKRDLRTIRDHMRKSVEVLTAESDTVAFALVVFDTKGQATAHFDSGGLMPLWAFPGACEYVLKSEVALVDEDFQAKLKKDRPFK